MKLHIISAALPPQLDGIGDYTAQLAAELARTTDVTILTGAPTPAPIPGVRVETVFDAHVPRSVWQLVDRVVQDRPDWVLLQYNPFSYGRWGLNLHLPRVMRRIKRDAPGTRFALMIHESFVSIESWQFALMTSWQRWQLWSLGQTADVVFCSIEAWTKKFARWFSKKPVVHIPVGSNIPLVPISRTEARTRLGITDDTIVLGLFGTAHVSRLLSPIRSAAEAIRREGHKVVLLYIGPHGKTIREAMGTIPVIDSGAVASEEVSKRFAAVDIYFAIYADGVSTRRTSLMTGLQHGLAIICTQGTLTDAILKKQSGIAFLLASVKSPDEIDDLVLQLANSSALRQHLGHDAQLFYKAEFDWSVISAHLIEALTKNILLRQKQTQARLPESEF